MRRLLRPLLLLAIPALAAAADWERGVALYNKGDHEAALAEFQDLVREKPDSAGAWYYIGLCEFKLKRFNRVEAPLARAIDLLEVQSPSSRDIEGAWYTIGFSHYLLGDYAKATAPLNRYLDIAGRAGREPDISARRALARSYFFLEKYDEALPLLRATATSKDQTKEAGADFYYAGAIHVKREEDDKAIASLREAAKLNVDDPSIFELMAETLMRRGRRLNAQSDWLEAAQAGEKLKSLRDDLRTASVLGRAHLGARQFEKAVEPLEKLAKSSPEDGQAWLYYGTALSRSGRMRKAMEALEITIQIVPESIPALLELAYVYESDKQYQQALRVYEKAYQAGGSSDVTIKGSIERVRALASQQP
jgi:tetratricopeptide (TPR) repeat protein